MVELIVVIVIILVLAAVLVPSLLKYIRKAQEAAAIEECAGVVKMAAVERSQWLADGGDAPTNEEIVQSAGANGKIIEVKYSKEDFDVTYMMYECKNGIVVIYEFDKDPQFRIAGENESNPLTIIDKWVQTTTNESQTLKDFVDRKELIKHMEDNGGLLKVDKTFVQGTIFNNDDNLYWRPYYVGQNTNRATFLYASDGNSGHGQWRAKIVYINGLKYVSDEVSGTQIDAIKDCKTLDEAKSWLETNNHFKAQ